MHRIRRRTMLSGGLAAALLLPARRAANAQEKYPARPVRFIVPFPPGSATDAMARIFSKVLNEMTGQAWVVENRAGGNGFIGAQAAIQAPPDGYTVFFGSNSTLSTNAALFKKLPYDPLTDFSPISVVFRGPCLVIVPPNSPFKTLGDLIAAAKAKPGALNYGAGSPAYQLYAEWLNELAGIKTTAIPFKGAGDAVTATVGGQVDFSVTDATGANELVRSGALRALVFTNDKRSTAVPDVPTSAEAGLPEFLASVWVAVAMPAKVPADVTRQLSELIQRAGATDEVKNYVERLGAIRPMNSPAEMHQFQKDEIARWKRLAAAAGLEPQ